LFELRFNYTPILLNQYSSSTGCLYKTEIRPKCIEVDEPQIIRKDVVTTLVSRTTLYWNLPVTSMFDDFNNY